MLLGRLDNFFLACVAMRPQCHKEVKKRYCSTASQEISTAETEAAKARAGAAAGAKAAARLAREAEKAEKEAVRLEADLAARDTEFKAGLLMRLGRQTYV
jgi:hypothetical protein